MKITGIDLDAVNVNHRGDWIFVHVLTDEGIQGLGELKAGNNYNAHIRAVRTIEEQIRGTDPRRIEATVNAFKKSTPDQVKALSAIEQALWDILGKSLDAPIHRLLGGACHDEIRVYANINRATTDRTPEGFARHAAAAVAEGFDAVKLAPFTNRGMDRVEEARDGIACLEAVRQAIGPHVDLLVDCHSRFTPRGALETAQAIQDLDMFWFEQPVPEADVEGCVKVKEECGLRVAGGEQRMLREGFVEVCQHQSMHVVMPDVKIVGGIGEFKGDCQSGRLSPARYGPCRPLILSGLLNSPGEVLNQFTRSGKNQRNRQNNLIVLCDCQGDAFFQGFGQRPSPTLRIHSAITSPTNTLGPPPRADVEAVLSGPLLACFCKFISTAIQIVLGQGSVSVAK